MSDGTRRDFLRTAAIGGPALALAATLPRWARAAPERALYRGASFVPPAYKAIRYGILGFVDQLRKSHDLKIEFYDSGTLMRADEQVRGLRVGSVQFVFHSTTYMTDEFPVLGILELPGVCEQLFHEGERLAMGSPLWNLINDELARSNLFMLSAGGGVIEPEYLWTGEKRIATLADLQGKRCRVVGYAATEILKGFGVTPVRIPSDQTHLAFQRGAVDAILSPVNTIVARNLHEHVRSCFKLPVTASGHAVYLLREVWDKAPASEREALWRAGKWYDDNQAKIGFKQMTQEVDWAVVKKAGIEIIQPSKPDAEAFAQRSRSAWEGWKKRVGEQLGQRAIDLAMGRA